ncbi:MAG: radical SAM protein [Xanthobacteraceae bacterium]
MQRIATIPCEPAAPMLHRFRSDDGEHLLVIPYSRLFDLSPELARILDRGGAECDDLVRALAQPAIGEDPLDDVVAPQPQSISLNVSSSCNLSCSYCYAARGGFEGAQNEPMKWETARAAIDALLARADATAPITVGFLGGEPFVNRALLHACVQYAHTEGAHRGLDVRFSVTTNGTLLRPEDIALIRAHRFAVTISIDGGAQVHNRQRPSPGKRDSFAQLRQAVAPLLAEPGLAQIAARATVTRHDFDLSRRFNDIVAVGFSEVGFAPLRMDKGRGDALREQDWPAYLEALQGLARSELARARSGAAIRLSNLAIALKQIARGASSPYPCGAGGGYFSVAADGRWYACHRAIGTRDFEMGDSLGLDGERRRAFLKRRHVHAQDACRTCWARYLCSGACHQEAAARSEPACDFIRSWLEFCLGAYCELSAHLEAKVL